MNETEIRNATASATSIASALGLRVDDLVVLQNSNKLTVRLIPCDVVARIAPASHQVAALEIELAQELIKAGSPVANLDHRVEPRPYERDGLVVTFWTYYPPVAREIPATEYAKALERLHQGMRQIHLTVPHFTDRVSEAENLVAHRDRTPGLNERDRELLRQTLQRLKHKVTSTSAPEQLLHGEPHPGNVLNTEQGPLFIDLETCCRGPIEFDLAHVPQAIAEAYTGVDTDLLDACRALVLAMVAAWRWDVGDRFPNGNRWAKHLIDTLRNGPPWPSLDVIADELAGA